MDHLITFVDTGGGAGEVSVGGNRVLGEQERSLELATVWNWLRSYLMNKMSAH